jgi:pimeloyl-ACP methyl ester carboxylesterase
MHADAAAPKPLTVRLTALNSTIEEAPFAAHASMMWHVEIARELARSGIPSLRFDLAGIGDSEASPHGTPHLYGALSEDMRAAIDWLRAHGIRDLTVFGTCSGAYQAFHAAVSDRRIASIALVNQLCFIWGPAYAMQLEAWRRTKARPKSQLEATRQNAAIAPLSARGL